MTVARRAVLGSRFDGTTRPLHTKERASRKGTPELGSLPRSRSSTGSWKIPRRRPWSRRSSGLAPRSAQSTTGEWKLCPSVLALLCPSRGRHRQSNAAKTSRNGARTAERRVGARRYADNPQRGFATSIRRLDGAYASLRRVRKDGNCFYRGFLYRYLEELLVAQLSHEVACGAASACPELARIRGISARTSSAPSRRGARPFGRRGARARRFGPVGDVRARIQTETVLRRRRRPRLEGGVARGGVRGGRRRRLLGDARRRPRQAADDDARRGSAARARSRCLRDASGVSRAARSGRVVPDRVPSRFRAKVGAGPTRRCPRRRSTAR